MQKFFFKTTGNMNTKNTFLWALHVCFLDTFMPLTCMYKHTLADIALGFVSLRERQHLCRHIIYLAASFSTCKLQKRCFCLLANLCPVMNEICLFLPSKLMTTHTHTHTSDSAIGVCLGYAHLNLYSSNHQDIINWRHL